MSYFNSLRLLAFCGRYASFWMIGITTAIKVCSQRMQYSYGLTRAGEYQPVYDEFGAILVLVMAFINRYDLTYYEIGIGHDTFVAKLLKRGHHSMLPDELTEEQGKHLGSWLKGLYDADKEGLSNDVFASCRPQDFYLIVPTLFRQTVMACSAGVLSFESVKGGLECK
jgi:mediator of RNA polymerase II transcription subunit 5